MAGSLPGVDVVDSDALKKPDVDVVDSDALKKLVLWLVERVSALETENAALREEIARLKGLKGRPKLKPSGMEKATAPEGGKRKKGRGGRAIRFLMCFLVKKGLALGVSADSICCSV